MTIGEQFKRLRKERWLTLREAAGDIVSVSSLSKFENGTSQLAADRFFLLLDRLNLDWDAFTPSRSDAPLPFLHRYLVAAHRQMFRRWQVSYASCRWRIPINGCCCI